MSEEGDQWACLGGRGCLDYTDVVKTCSLWVAPFPKPGILNYGVTWLTMSWHAFSLYLTVDMTRSSLDLTVDVTSCFNFYPP